MKEITKHRLKQVNRLLKICLLTFCWLMACVGLTAYSVYWLRQNANYEQEVYKHDLKPKRAVNEYDYSFWQVNNNRVNDELYYDAVNPPYTEYFHFTSAGAYVSIAYTYKGDILVKNVDTDIEYEGIQFQFEYHSAGFYNIYTIKLIGNGQSDLLIFTNNSPSTYNDCVIRFSNMRVWWADNIADDTDLGVMRYYFYELIDTAYSSSLHIDGGVHNATNFLLSSNRMGYSQATYFPNYNLQLGYKLTIPMVFESNGLLFDAIVIYPQYCYAYRSTNGQQVDNYGHVGGIDNMPFITSYICYQLYGETLVANVSESSTSGGVTYSYETIDSFTGGVVAGAMPYTGFLMVETSTTNKTLFPIFDLYKGIQINDLYNSIRYHASILDEKAQYSWWHGTAIASLPIDYMTYRDVLSYFDYNGPTNYVINVNTDVGLQNAFTLMSEAFSGLAGLLSIQVLPGLTLGLFVFIPLLVTILIVVIRLVKK